MSAAGEFKRAEPEHFHAEPRAIEDSLGGAWFSDKRDKPVIPIPVEVYEARDLCNHKNGSDENARDFPYREWSDL